jgi:hypothetical protein
MISLQRAATEHDDTSATHVRAAAPVIAVATSRVKPRESTLTSVLMMMRVPVWIGSCYALLKTNADPDLWGHLRFGLDTLAARHVSVSDPYSYTSDLPWMNHEWLSELLMAIAYRGFGNAGLVALKMAIIVGTFALLVPVVRRVSELWAWPSAFVALLGIIPVSLTIRPQLWTLLFVVALCRILNAAPRYRLLLPFLFLVWVNVHGGWVVGAGILLIWSAIEVAGLAKPRPPLWVSLGVPVACAVATLGNPYGAGLWVFVAKTVRLSRADIIEWQPVWRASVGMVGLWLLAVGWSALAIWRAHTWRPQAAAILAVFAFASFRVNRLVPLFILMSVTLLLPYVQQRRFTPPTWPKGRTLVDFVFACVAVLLVAWPASAGCIGVTSTWLPDVEAARALEAAHPRGRMATWFDWGEYAIWHFGPAAQVSFDGRRETVYSEAVRQRQAAIAFGEDAGLEELARATPEYVWLPVARSERTRNWLKAHNYRIDIQTNRSFVAVRSDLPTIHLVPGTGSACFPGL